MPTNTTTKTATRKIPTPLYAAAGAGDLAYEQLRKLPAQVAHLRARVNELRPAVTGAVSETSLRADIDRLRDVARRNASQFLHNAQAGAQVAQDRALAVYSELVARGEKVVSTARGAEAKIELEPAEKAVTAEVTTTERTTDETAAQTADETAEQTAEPSDPAQADPAKKAVTAAKKTTANKK